MLKDWFVKYKSALELKLFSWQSVKIYSISKAFSYVVK